MDDAKAAVNVFRSICEMLDDNNLKYHADEQELLIETGLVGDDLRMPVRIRVDQDHGIVSLLSVLPINIPPEKFDEVAYAVTRVNWTLTDGDFDFDSDDPEDGTIIFRMTTTYEGGVLSKDLFTYMIGASLGIVDVFNDRFDDLVAGKIGVDAFERH